MITNTNRLFTWVCWSNRLKIEPIYIDCAIVNWLPLRTGGEQGYILFELFQSVWQIPLDKQEENRSSVWVDIDSRTAWEQLCQDDSQTSEINSRIFVLYWFNLLQILVIMPIKRVLITHTHTHLGKVFLEKAWNIISETGWEQCRKLFLN